MNRWYQNRDGIPAELAEEQRFIELTAPRKDAFSKDWSEPYNWKTLDEIPEGKPFSCVLSNPDSTFAFIDYDHCILDNGKLYEPAWQFYQKTVSMGGTYTEKSISGNGLHQVVDLGDFSDSFGSETKDVNSVILWMNPEEYGKLSKAEKDRTPKIELFHKRTQNCILTGNRFRNNKSRVASGELAASIWSAALDLRSDNHQKYGYTAASKNTVSDTPRVPADDSTKSAIVEALKWISADSYEMWIRIGQACYNAGLPFEIWDDWSRFKDQRNGVACDKYNPAETPKKWESFKRTPSLWNAGTIFLAAQENGWTGHNVLTLKPEDETDLGQSEVFVREYADRIRYSQQTGYLVYDGKVWKEDDLKAHALAQALTDRQLAEAKTRINLARKALDTAVESEDDAAIAKGKEQLGAAERFRKYVLQYRSSAKIGATLKEAAPKVAIDIKQLDADGYLLNTPSGTIDLRTGAFMSHDPEDYCTKITAVAPDDVGAEKFDAFLKQITCNDEDLQRYLQEIIGLSAIGSVKTEQLIIAVGEGGNGKSTFFNLIAKVLNDYSGMLSSEVLTTGCRKNKSPEYAELRGRRLVISAELEEGCRLDTGVVKKLCSTDPVQCEPKYKAPYSFIPSHHVVLYTNHLPRIGSQDAGTWDRIVVVPFNARFRGQAGEVKDYAGELFDKCGGAVLKWIIEGAQRVIQQRFFIEQPARVIEAIEEYKRDNDWLGNFIDETCVRDMAAEAGAGELYRFYRDYCTASGEWCRHSSEFAQALDKAGYKGHKTKAGKVYLGLRLKKVEERIRDEKLTGNEAVKRA